jgi:hypothetical protein
VTADSAAVAAISIRRQSDKTFFYQCNAVNITFLLTIFKDAGKFSSM